jgi:hypothetical protein
MLFEEVSIIGAAVRTQSEQDADLAATRTARSRLRRTRQNLCDGTLVHQATAKGGERSIDIRVGTIGYKEGVAIGEGEAVES